MLRKNCEPPLLGAPVLAIEIVPTSFDSSPTSSSGMLPPPSRLTFDTEEFSGAPDTLVDCAQVARTG